MNLTVGTKTMNLRHFALFLFLFPLHVFAANNYTNIDNQQLKALQAQGIPVYDVRRAEEWAQTGVIEGSHKLTFTDDKGRVMPDFVEKFTKAVGKADPVILICRTGNRTDMLSRALAEQLGYTKIYNVKNGITRWIGEGLPVVKN
jgi:rhodanese-related sulfurtransferase